MASGRFRPQLSRSNNDSVSVWASLVEDILSVLTSLAQIFCPSYGVILNDCGSLQCPGRLLVVKMLDQ